MNVRGWGIVCAVALMLLLAACGRAEPTPAPALDTPAASQPDALLARSPNAAGYVDITIDELASLLAQKEFTLVNVHIPYEGELPQTDLFIPFDEIEDHLAQLPAKDAPIVLYCRSGRMSTDAAEVLFGLGYTNLYELDGGFNAWAAAGYELLDER